MCVCKHIFIKIISFFSVSLDFYMMLEIFLFLLALSDKCESMEGNVASVADNVSASGP